MPSHASAPRVAVRVGADVAHYPPGATYGPRVLHDYEFVWLLSGSATWSVKGSSIDLRPGVLLLARPGMEDRIRWDSDQASVHAYVHFRLLDRGGLGTPDQWPLSRSLGTGNPIDGLCHYLLWLGSTPTPAAARRANEVVQWILDLFVRGPMPDGDDGEPLPEHLVRVLDFVRSQWADGPTTALSVRELADGAGISPGHLSRMFRTTWGVGPVAALELLRLARAATLLQRSNLTVVAISEVSGFANPYHFSRRFRITYGVSPRTFRAERSGDDPLGPVTRAGLLSLAYALL